MEPKTKNRKLQFDESGFLTEPETWNRDIAELIAFRQGMNVLTKAHWRMIDQIRAIYSGTNKMPMVGHICSEMNVTLKGIYKLFPKGAIHGLVKIAGLPKPENCV